MASKWRLIFHLLTVYVSDWVKVRHDTLDIRILDIGRRQGPTIIYLVTLGGRTSHKSYPPTLPELAPCPRRAHQGRTHVPLRVPFSRRASESRSDSEI